MFLDENQEYFYEIDYDSENEYDFLEPSYARSLMFDISSPEFRGQILAMRFTVYRKSFYYITLKIRPWISNENDHEEIEENMIETRIGGAITTDFSSFDKCFTCSESSYADCQRFGGFETCAASGKNSKYLLIVIKN